MPSSGRIQAEMIMMRIAIRNEPVTINRIQIPPYSFKPYYIGLKRNKRNVSDYRCDVINVLKKELFRLLCIGPTKEFVDTKRKLLEQKQCFK